MLEWIENEHLEYKYTNTKINGIVYTIFKRELIIMFTRN